MQSDKRQQLSTQVNYAVRARKPEAVRQTLSALLDNFKSPDPALRQLCIRSLERLFSDAPEFKERCINSVYDACEDSDPDVRKEGYKAISKFSNRERSLVRRNTDVLVQLLQSDDQDELRIIKTSLSEHIMYDAPATIQVLGDSCAPAANAMEDPADREQLRNLVLDFLTNPPDGNLIHLLKKNDVQSQRIVISGLCKAIPFSTPTQTRSICDLVLKSASITESSDLSNILINSLVDRIDHELNMMQQFKQTDMPSLEIIVTTSCSAVQKLPNCDPLPLLQQLCPVVLVPLKSSVPPPTSVVSRALLESLFIVSSRFVSPSGCGAEAATCLNALIDESTRLLPAMLTVPVMWQEIGILLQSILDVSCFIDMSSAFSRQRSKRSSWSISRPHLDALQKVGKEAQGGSNSPYKQGCITLLKEVLPPSRPKGVNERGLSFVNAAQNAQHATRNIAPPLKRKHDDEPPRIPPTRPVSAPSLATRMGIQQLPTEPSTIRSNRASFGQQPPLKKMKEDVRSPTSPSSSLLARIQDGNKSDKIGKGGGSVNPRDGKSTNGFSIRGAAAKPTLQDRLG